MSDYFQLANTIKKLAQDHQDEIYASDHLRATENPPQELIAMLGGHWNIQSKM